MTIASTAERDHRRRILHDHPTSIARRAEAARDPFSDPVARLKLRQHEERQELAAKHTRQHHQLVAKLAPLRHNDPNHQFGRLHPATHTREAGEHQALQRRQAAERAAMATRHRRELDAARGQHA